MSIYEIIANIHGKAELPAMLFALRLGGRGRRSYSSPGTLYIQKGPPGFIGRHPVIFSVIGLLLFGLLLIIAGK